MSMMSIDIERILDLNKARLGYVEGLTLSGEVAVRSCHGGFILPVRNSTSASFARLLNNNRTRLVRPIDSDRVGVFFINDLLWNGLDGAEVLDYEVTNWRKVRIEGFEHVLGKVGQLVASATGPLLQVASAKSIEDEKQGYEDLIDDFFSRFDGLDSTPVEDLAEVAT